MLNLNLNQPQSNICGSKFAWKLGPNYMVHIGVATIKLKPSYNMGQIGLKRENYSYRIIFCPESNFNALDVYIAIICLPSQKIGFVSDIFSKL